MAQVKISLGMDLELYERFTRLVPYRERSKFIRQALERALDELEAEHSFAEALSKEQTSRQHNT